jgi:hypothetical protein
MAQYEDIKQKIKQGLTDRQIAKSVGRRRSTISEIRSGKYKFEDQNKLPGWMSLVNWDEILKNIGLKHPLSLIWEESAQQLTSYSNFTRYLHKKFPQLKVQNYTHRYFNPGERVEVDWAGDAVEWLDPQSGKINKAYIFVGCLGYSQLIFAKAYSSMKQVDFLTAHESMFNFYGGGSNLVTEGSGVPLNQPLAETLHNRVITNDHGAPGLYLSQTGVISPLRRVPVDPRSPGVLQRLLQWGILNLVGQVIRIYRLCIPHKSCGDTVKYQVDQLHPFQRGHTSVLHCSLKRADEFGAVLG